MSIHVVELRQEEGMLGIYNRGNLIRGASHPGVEGVEQLTEDI